MDLLKENILYLSRGFWFFLVWGFLGVGGGIFLFWFCWFVLLGGFCNLYTNCFNASLQFQSRYASATFKKVLLIIDSIYKLSLQTLPILGRVLKNSYSRAVTTVLAIISFIISYHTEHGTVIYFSRNTQYSW